ncbi:uncharacterized protein isoform X2 [Choristoneura fumiferana]|uniref:uncharacterized protein isoform X2 n=1 Tax=Choristoneura fumiferana TaxID=7141 RepID=UPI003D157A96
MRIEKFFGRFSLRTGSMAVTTLYTVISVAALITVYHISGSNVLPKDKLFPLQICTTFVSIVVITFCSLFVLGIKKVRPELMHPCVLLDVIVGFILSFALPFAIVKFYKYDSKVKAACTTVIGVLYLIDISHSSTACLLMVGDF